jgi:ABC-type multidrug transport system ATPase subunit
MMAGEFPPTSGSGKLAGLDMLNDREEINKYMGYCPQFDALFPKLTATEHLMMYARVKGIDPSIQESVVANLTKMMNLTPHKDREAGGYSGGNKRKLSVAIALLGGPKIVFLDEPSTGMDPEARRFMWKVIHDTMAGRSVILTTHSMEEAEALSNRIGIMVGGRLRCIGTNQHLKDKFGKGYSLEVRADESRNAQLQQWILGLFPGSKVKENLGNQVRFKVPMDINLSRAWEQVEKGKYEYQIEEYAISQTTLEQVFVRFASEQEEETGMDGASLAASIKEVIPNFIDLCLCRPKKVYEWTVNLDNNAPPLKVKVEFMFGACLCCKSNPGIVTVNGDPVKRLDEYGQETADDLWLTDRSNPGCAASGCCSCDSCCGCNDWFCCRNTLQTFRHSGRLFEVIDYNEIPNTARARPCFLMVENKAGEMIEANTGIARGSYMSTLFEQGGKKYCLFVGLPLVVIMFLLLQVETVRWAALVVLPFFLWFSIYCICGNWCGRANHYRNAPEVHFTELPTASPSLNTTSENQLVKD